MKKGKTLKIESKDMLVGDKLKAALQPAKVVLEKKLGVSLDDCGGCLHAIEALGTTTPRPHPPTV